MRLRLLGARRRGSFLRRQRRCEHDVHQAPTAVVLHQRAQRVRGGGRRWRNENPEFAVFCLQLGGTQHVQYKRCDVGGGVDLDVVIDSIQQ
jgi:hypothetical protein